MNRKSIGALVAVALSTLVFNSTALAQDRGGPRDARHDERHDERHEPRYDGSRPPPPPRMERHDDRSDARHDDRGGARHDDHRFAGRGAGPDHSYYRGGRLPAYYRSRQYVVDDWRGHRLSAPPRGSHWVQTGSDYVLVAITTGIITSILLSN